MKKDKNIDFFSFGGIIVEATRLYFSNGNEHEVSFNITINRKIDFVTKEEYVGYLKGNILKYQLRLAKKDNVDKEVIKIKDYTQELNSILKG